MSHIPLQLKELTIRRALLSVSDKTGIVRLATTLLDHGVEIISTGGTARVLREAGLPVTDVAEVTRFPECFDGRIKTLHPAILGAMLARPSLEDHRQTLQEMNIEPIQLVAVNLYPFEKAVKDRPKDLTHAIENIDIGGPSMVRAAAKNIEHVCILTDPGQYDGFCSELTDSGNRISVSTRIELSLQAFRLTGRYDQMIAGELERLHGTGDTLHGPGGELTIQSPLSQMLRYGENPHQQAAVYGYPDRFTQKLHGKELSYNNYLDMEAALQLGANFQDSDEALCAIFKHNMPCGVALASHSAEAWEKAFSADTLSPFGGIILFNRTLDIETARATDRIFSEIIMAPGFEPEALALLRKKANRRLILIKKYSEPGRAQIRSISGGYLHQQQDPGQTLEKREVVTAKKPDEAMWRDLEFAWKVVRHVLSNAIVYASGCKTIGIGSGQPNRFDASRFAVQKAEYFGHDTAGSVVASDGFFPFADGVEEAAKAGAKAVIQPGGSRRDTEVIARADELGMVMIMTGSRYFRH